MNEKKFRVRGGMVMFYVERYENGKWTQYGAQGFKSERDANIFIGNQYDS